MMSLFNYSLHKILKIVNKALNFKQTPYSPKSFVIGVGSPVLGGAGKTETVSFLFSKLKNFQPVILAKGYKGRIKRPTEVLLNHKPSDVGDEPLMLAQRGCTVWVSNDKTEGVKALEDKFKIIILDDSLQHRKLNCSYNILTLPYDDEKTLNKIFRNLLFPFGPLRDDFYENLKRCDVVLCIARSGELPDFDVKVDKPFYFAKYQFDVPNIESAVVVTGIARPEAFIESVAKKVKICKVYTYRDHHQYSEKEISKLEQLTIPIITTEKDWVKIKQFAKSTLWSPVYLSLYVFDEKKFIDDINIRLNAKNRCN